MNPSVKITKSALLSDNWYSLKKYTFDYQKADGSWETQEREAYDRGNGAAILLYNKTEKKVVLTRQFRLPTYINGNDSGMMIEACAGILDLREVDGKSSEENAEDCIKREAEEETGYKISKVEKVMEAYMSPGSVTEILYFFIGEYSAEMKIHEGGGLASEQENIEVLEYDFEEALAMIYNGQIKDAKTILLLQHAQIKNIFS